MPRKKKETPIVDFEIVKQNPSEASAPRPRIRIPEEKYLVEYSDGKTQVIGYELAEVYRCKLRKPNYTNGRIKSVKGIEEV